jgi:MYXO-CTERM domain-containing protein
MMLSALVAFALSVSAQVPLFTVAAPPGYTEVAFSSAVASGNRICFVVEDPVVFGVVVCDRDGDGTIDIEVPSAFGAVAMNDAGDFVYVGPTGNLFVQRGDVEPVELPGSGGNPFVQMNAIGDVLYANDNVIQLDQAIVGRTVIAFVNQPITSLGVTPSVLRNKGLTESGRVIFEIIKNTGGGAVIEAGAFDARFIFDTPPASPEPAAGTVVEANGIAVGSDGDVWASGTVAADGTDLDRWVYAPPGGTFTAVDTEAPFGNISLFGVDSIGNAFVEMNNLGLQTIDPDGTVSSILNLGDTVPGLSQPVTFANIVKVSPDGRPFIIAQADEEAAQLTWNFIDGLQVLWSTELGAIVDGAFDPAASGFDTFAAGTSLGRLGALSGHFFAGGGPLLVTTFPTDFANSSGEGEGEGEGEGGEGEGEAGEGEGESSGEGEGETGDDANFVVAIDTASPLAFQSVNALELNVTNAGNVDISVVTVVVTITVGDVRLAGAVPDNCSASEGQPGFEGGGEALALLGFTCIFPSLAVGDSENVSIAILPVGGTTTLEVAVVGTTPDQGEDPAGNSVERVFPVAASGNADVGVTVSGQELQPNGHLATITVVNNGPDDAADVELSHTPVGDGLECDAGSCVIGSMAVGERLVFNVRLGASVEQLDATVTTSSNDANLDNNTATVAFPTGCSATSASRAPPSFALLVLAALFARRKKRNR